MDNLRRQAEIQASGATVAADTEAQELKDLLKAKAKKERKEGADETAAILASDTAGGRAQYWHRRVFTTEMVDGVRIGESRNVAMAERAGSYPPRRFLALAAKAAGQAGKGRWNRPEAVEAVAAELVARTLAKTGGRMPNVGSLGRSHTGHDNPDLAYLTASARRLIASAQRGDVDAAGLAAEAAPVSGDVDAGPDYSEMSLGEMAAESEAAAEGRRDDYLAAGKGPLCEPDTLAAIGKVARAAGSRTAAVEAATVAALRPVANSADLAEAGLAKSPGAARKAASVGRSVLRQALPITPGGPSRWTARDWAVLEAVADLAAADRRTPERRHPLEGNGPGAYHAPKLTWPDRIEPLEHASITVRQSAVTADGQA